MATSAIDQKDKDETGTNISEADKEKDTKSDTSTKSVLEQAAETLASIREFDQKWNDMERKFQSLCEIAFQSLSLYGSASHSTIPVKLTEKEKLAVLGGNPTVKELSSRLASNQYNKVMIMVGAGLSVSAGIPDFRTPGSGLYSNLQKYNLPTPESVFDLEYFKANPKPFCKLAQELFPGQIKPTVGHCFIKLLQDKGMLKRCYTQNIDGLERLVGVKEELLVEAHGGFSTASCIKCKKSADINEVKQTLFNGKVPFCQSCEGLVKPDIVFFGESLPEAFSRLYREDTSGCDLLVVMGTSLQVAPFCNLVNQVQQTVPRLLINKEAVGPFKALNDSNYRDVCLLSECDAGAEMVCELAGWKEYLQKVKDSLLDHWKK